MCSGMILPGRPADGTSGFMRPIGSSVPRKRSDHRRFDHRPIDQDLRLPAMYVVISPVRSPPAGDHRVGGLSLAIIGRRTVKLAGWVQSGPVEWTTQLDRTSLVISNQGVTLTDHGPVEKLGTSRDQNTIRVDRDEGPDSRSAGCFRLQSLSFIRYPISQLDGTTRYN
jgi:hypothetical protein